MEKLITFIIPCYNARKYVERCIASMISVSLMNRIEIIVVNDGSTDDTADIAMKYVNSYPQSISLINKENGGHGSAVNVAVTKARGRYFKVVDADDWIVTDNLEAFLDALERNDADAVINSFCTVNCKSGKVTRYGTDADESGEIMTTDRLIELYDRISACCSIHGITYKLDTYLKSGCRLSEGVSYDDNEYAILPFSAVKKVLLLPFDLYQYQIGDSEQSVSARNQVKRIGDLIKVTNSIIDFWDACRGMPVSADKYFMLKTAQVAVSVLATALVRNPRKAEGRKLAEKFWNELGGRKPQLASLISSKYKVLRILNHIRFPGALYQLAGNSRIYKSFRLWWSNNKIR